MFVLFFEDTKTSYNELHLERLPSNSLASVQSNFAISIFCNAVTFELPAKLAADQDVLDFFTTTIDKVTILKLSIICITTNFTFVTCLIDCKYC